MEYVENGSIDSYLKKGAITQSLAWSYFRDLICGLEYCHQVARVVHRDIKPENILIDSNGRAKISDFGVSYMMDPTKNDIVTTTAGSHFFLAPEAISKDIFKGEPSDIWACGVTLYYMVKGHLPFDTSSVSALYKLILNTEPKYEGMEADLVDLIKRMLIKNPEERIKLCEIKVLQ
jgi:serine/threonine protein kinase